MYVNPFEDQAKCRKSLADYMLKYGLSRKDTAKKIGTSGATLSRFIDKGLNIKINVLSKIMKYLEKEHNEHSKDSGRLSE